MLEFAVLESKDRYIGHAPDAAGRADGARAPGLPARGGARRQVSANAQGEHV